VDGIAPDGSPVAVYLRLPAGDVPQLVHRAVGEGATILELGCGVGRITHPLVALGHRVVAVDNSADMLRHVHGAQTVLADIETLQLPERFDAVLLASHLINAPEVDERQRLFSVCKQHVRAGGVVLAERYDVEWARDAKPEVHHVGDVTISWHDIAHDGDVLHAAITYTVDDHSSTQRFTAMILDDAQLCEEAAAAGLELESWIGEHREWARFVA
jgi:SAM-dependent methyltransferase